MLATQHDQVVDERAPDRSAVVTFVERIFGLRPADDDPSPIGPWGPVLRMILPRLSQQAVLGPHPEPWLLVALNPQPLPPAPHSWSWAALNPQPLPPLPAMMLEALLSRTELIADVGKATGSGGAAIDYVRSMVEDLCPPPRRIPIPPRGGDGDPPPRPNELVVSATDLIVLGAGLRQAAAWTAHPELAAAYVEMGHRAMDVGVEALGARAQPG